ncbi:hypothetical protein L873DRAFT_1795701 [Choiromyces venosus 120613-1]|uniref:Uncharacterized protein n=1 Tax=Choiromyces venosus 120613-1 TaxID=1336337 RepID=A0A3N4J0I2_9PEZI|nr:hypothetical protein L873DRAFT_1795701 [Choiromyces venosus 120613-1]
MPQNDANPPNAGYNTQADEFKSAHSDSSVITPGQAKTLHNIPVAPSAENAPRKETKEQAPRKKRLSFGGGNDGRGNPMFANLESARGKHMLDGYDDQKPPDGFIGAAFKRFISAKSGAAVGGGK